MKLGIAVVYAVHEQNEALLAMHLRRIRRHTKAPYRIYGTAVRLLPRFRDELRRDPKVTLLEFSPTTQTGGAEHSYYLDQLIQAAFNDGVTHVVTLHVDSFPIRSGWEQELAQKLSDTCVMATIEENHTACLFFHREFYARFRPTLLPSIEEKKTPPYREYIEKFHHAEHSGFGYGLRVYSEGLSAYFMKPSQNALARGAAFGVYEAGILHVGGHLRLTQRWRPVPKVLQTAGYLGLIEMIASGARRFPVGTRLKVRNWLSVPLDYAFDRPRIAKRMKLIEEFRLDPDAFIDKVLSSDSRGT